MSINKQDMRLSEDELNTVFGGKRLGTAVEDTSSYKLHCLKVDCGHVFSSDKGFKCPKCKNDNPALIERIDAVAWKTFHTVEKI